MEKSPEQWIAALQRFTGKTVRSVKNSAMAKLFCQQSTNEQFDRILNTKKCQIVGMVLVASALFNTAQNLDKIAENKASKYIADTEEYLCMIYKKFKTG